jgi:hypothetical protein
MVDHMQFKRTGWQLYYWKKNGELLTNRYMEIVPQDDLREHVAGDECWCNPKIENYDPDANEEYNSPIITHHSADNREITEPIR